MLGAFLTSSGSLNRHQLARLPSAWQLTIPLSLSLLVHPGREAGGPVELLQRRHCELNGQGDEFLTVRRPKVSRQGVVIPSTGVTLNHPSLQLPIPGAGSSHRNYMGIIPYSCPWLVTQRAIVRC